MSKYINKSKLKIVWNEVLQYLALYVIYVFVSKIAFVPSFCLGEPGTPFYFSNYQLADFLQMLVTLIAIATKPTPITVIVLGYQTFNIFGYDDQVFFMVLLPLVYFMVKKGIYKSFKNRVIVVIIGIFSLALDLMMLWYHKTISWNVYRHQMGMFLIAFIITCVYAVYKPKFVRKFFKMTEERKESRVLSLSTRIIFVFGVAVVSIFFVVMQSMNTAVERINNESAIDDGSRLAGDITAFFWENGLTQATLKDFLNEKGRGYEGIWGWDTKKDEWLVEYQDDAKIMIDNSLIQALYMNNYDIIYGQGGAVDVFGNVRVYDQRMVFLRYHVLEKGYEGESLFDLYLMKSLDQDYVKQKNVIEKCFIDFFAILCLGIPVFFWFIEWSITRPINLMTGLVSKYAFENEENREELEEEFTNLAIRSGDEIENLYQSFGKTILDMNNYVNTLNLKNEQIQKMQLSMIMTMANVVENRDSNTGMHIKRTAEYVEIIAKKMQEDVRFKEILTDKYVDDMKIAAPLHDMGKIHVSDTILNKPGKLDDEEYAIMKTHTTEGKKLLIQAIEDFGKFDYLVMAVEMAGSHHERFDGHGYPEGLKGEEIPLCARIMAVADVFDALVSKRSYKEGMPLAKAYSIIEEGRGTQFDPDVVDAFLASKVQIERYYTLMIS